jgi:hypothetical protein
MEIISKKSAKTLGLTRYFTGKACPKGHVSERSVSTGHCCECERNRSAERRISEPEKYKEIARASQARNREKNKEKQKAAYARWYKKNADALREKRLAFYQANAEKLKERARIARVRDADKIRERQRKHRLEKREQINQQQAERRRSDPDRYKSYMDKWREKHGEKHNEKIRERRNADPVYSFIGRARCLIRGAIARAGFRKAKKTEEILGCSIEQFRLQIERQFLPGMGWHNMHLWHIDHIVPVSSAKTIEEAESLNTAGNLRPYWAKDNKRKFSKRTHLL